MAHILVVEDEKDSRELVVEYLKRKGHTVTSAADGEGALGVLLNSHPDVVILDVRMPRMDGIGLLELLRTYLRWTRLPVILVTGEASPGEMRRARELGVTYIFHKASFQLGELGEAVEALCHPPDGGRDTIAG